MATEQTYHTEPLEEDKPFSIKEELHKLGNTLLWLMRYWKVLLLMAVIGALAGLAWRWLKPVSYIARTSFVVEESKMGSGSLASALAGSIGIDIGSLTGGSSGVLAGDNVLALVKSHSLIRETLLTPYDSAKGISLADRYMEVKGWKEKWAGSSKVGKLVKYPIHAVALGRLEDSLLQKTIDNITEKDINISKPDKKLGFFELTVSMRDEKLSYLFNQRLLQATTMFYIETKTRRLSNNVKRLQAKADSLALALNRKTYSAADANRLLLDANPVYAAPEVNAEITTRDKYTQGTIYAEIIKNLEISKTALIQETPTIQVVDDPEIPLKTNKIKAPVAIAYGALLFLAFTSGILLVRRK